MKSTVETKICELVKRGYLLSSEVSDENTEILRSSVAAMLSDLASQLEVQLVRSNALAAKLSMINGLMDAAEQANKLAQEATEKLVQERDALAAENAGLKETFEYVINPDNQPEYHDQGMGCGVEDHGYQRDGYSACAYGWESAMERVYSEVIPDAIPETPATSAFLAEVRNEAGARAVELFAKTLGSPYSFRDEKCYEDGFARAIEVVRDVQDPRFAAQLRKGVQS
ncbi:hNH endonuclease [Citrobacter koseri]|uniref:hNH endonuclease n=1 Tax=Citrobacter koseri TaxID=545 RepID=UPI001F3A4A49|nr:hNH endonuclease [Citrobacter koseri]